MTAVPTLMAMTRETSQRLTDAVSRHREAREAEEEARRELYAAILDSIDQGARQVDIVRVTGYTREHIRQLVRAAREAVADEESAVREISGE
jgi:Zn-dependent M32 family carboxypeptidase